MRFCVPVKGCVGYYGVAYEHHSHQSEEEECKKVVDEHLFYMWVVVDKEENPAEHKIHKHPEYDHGAAYNGAAQVGAPEEIHQRAK
jgi:hypothetical protein